MLADGTQEYPSDVCRAAVITEVAKDADGAVLDTAGLAVLNPTGMFFHPLSNGGSLMDSTGRKPGSWHWPERL